MKILFDFLPVILFFAAFKAFDIYIATGVAIAVSVIQLAFLKWSGKKIEAMLLVSVVIIVVAGGATLFFHDEQFIKWKPTLLYWAMGIALAIARFAMKKNPLASLFKGQILLPDSAWSKLTIAWVIFFAILGVVNIWVAMNFPTETWVNFKVFGGMGLMLVFVVAQAIWMSKYLTEANPVAVETPEDQ